MRYKMLRWALVLGLLVFARSIDQTCSSSQPCPINSQCQGDDYCVCDSGFIGDCSVPAASLSTDSINSTLAPNQTNLFYTDPIALNKYIQFTYTVCQNVSSQLTLTFTLWGQSGQNTQYTSANSLVSSSQLTLNQGCSNIATPFIQFGTQPNGQDEMLILGIGNNSPLPATISISVSQKAVVGFLIYYYVLIGLGAFVILFIVVGGAIFVARRRRLRALAGQANANGPEQPEVVDLSYFQTEMPSFKGQLLGNERSICPICLMQVQKKQLVRKTPCGHCFHVSCIDSWCVKNLNCPVCRSDLSLEKVREKKAQDIAVAVYHPVVEERMEERPQQPVILVEQKYEIRENML